MGAATPDVAGSATEVGTGSTEAVGSEEPVLRGATMPVGATPVPLGAATPPLGAATLGSLEFDQLQPGITDHVGLLEAEGPTGILPIRVEVVVAVVEAVSVVVETNTEPVGAATPLDPQPG